MHGTSSTTMMIESRTVIRVRSQTASTGSKSRGYIRYIPSPTFHAPDRRYWPEAEVFFRRIGQTARSWASASR